MRRSVSGEFLVLRAVGQVNETAAAVVLVPGFDTVCIFMDLLAHETAGGKPHIRDGFAGTEAVIHDQHIDVICHRPFEILDIHVMFHRTDDNLQTSLLGHARELLFGAESLTQGHGDKLPDVILRYIETVQPGLIRDDRIVLPVACENIAPGFTGNHVDLARGNLDRTGVAAGKIDPQRL